MPVRPSPAVAKRRSAKEMSGHAEFRLRLLHAVERLLETGVGFGELGIAQIVAEAGTSRSTFYLHFKDKSQLLDEAFRTVMDELLQVAGLTWQLPPDSDRDTVRRAMGEVVAAFSAHARLMVAVSDIAGADGRVGSSLATLMEQGRHNLAAHIESGQRDGSVRVGVDAGTVAGLLVAMAERGLSRLTPGVTEQERDIIADSLTHIVWCSLYEGAPARR